VSAGRISRQEGRPPSRGEAPGLVFGPVPSRRLGRSLGINNVPPKTCSYACVYCQLGRTTRMESERTVFHEPEAVRRSVLERLDHVHRAGESIDYLTFVPDGEPTLDLRLGEEIALLKPLGKPVAVITNASLLARPDVRDELAHADWVSVKVDAVSEDTWHRLNRPHRDLDLDEIRNGLLQFAKTFGGRLVTETMLVRDVDDDIEQVKQVAAFVGRLNPSVAYIAAPTRPPAEKWAEAPAPSALVEAYEAFAAHADRVELLTGYEGNEFTSSGSAERSLLEITSVHPMRAEAVEALLARAGENWAVVEGLVAAGRLVKLDHEGHTFYARRLPGT
jgi:wyosine [tRNA(Phe)-imidazoG37] synthetase (radical SAM superfamily)